MCWEMTLSELLPSPLHSVPVGEDGVQLGPGTVPMGILPPRLPVPPPVREFALLAAALAQPLEWGWEWEGVVRLPCVGTPRPVLSLQLRSEDLIAEFAQVTNW